MCMKKYDYLVMFVFIGILAVVLVAQVGYVTPQSTGEKDVLECVCTKLHGYGRVINHVCSAGALHGHFKC